jgi:uncharacterized protein YggT (Ycf19 family)
MADDVQKVRETTTQSGDTVQKTTESRSSRNDSDHRYNFASRIVWFIAGILLILLGFRFVLALLGANTTNSFANFIYKCSHPFVSPFFSLFSYKQNYGVSHFEIYTLVAIVVYAIIAWGIVKLFTLNQD